MRRSEYSKQGNPLALKPDLKKVPLEMYEARNAVEIAKSRGAEQYSPEVFSKAQSSLQGAENVLAQDSGKNKVISAARQTIQFAEDARALAVRRETAERIQKEKEAAATSAAAKAKAEADAEAAAEANRQAELTAAKEAQMNAEGCSRCSGSESETSGFAGQGRSSQGRCSSCPSRHSRIACAASAAAQRCPADDRYAARLGGEYGRRTLRARKI
jgi:hypothetical protein